jgi:hypothetical protein
MGWCSGTKIFDVVVEGLIDKKRTKTPKEIIKLLAEAMEYMDWDCQEGSKYWDHPIVQEVFKELHPDWFEEEE